MRRTSAAILATALVTLPACALLEEDHEPIVIPEGAQVVHVTVSADEVSLEPSLVEAGEVYLVNEGPDPGFQLISRMSAEDASPGGFTQEQVDRVATGDLQDTMLDFSEVFCERPWNEAEHWNDCGEKYRMTLTEGLYVIMAGSAGEPGPGSIMAVLEVMP